MDSFGHGEHGTMLKELNGNLKEHERRIWMTIAEILIILGTALGLAVVIVLWLIYP